MRVDSKFALRLKDRFDFDVSALPAYTDEQATEFLTDLIESSNFLSKLQVEEDVKGSKTIKLLNGDVTLQEVTGCTLTPDGSIVFDGKNLVTKRLGMAIKFCNEDLNGKFTQMLNVIGSNRQDSEMVLEAVIMAYIAQLVKRKSQRLALLGDTDSIDPELAISDGFIKKFDADGDMEVYYSAETAIDDTNGYTIVKGLIDTIPAIVFDKALNMSIIIGRTEALGVIAQYDTLFPTKNSIVYTDVDGVMSFTFPNTTVRVETVPELNGLNKAYSVCWDYMFLGTDLESDMDGLSIKYDDYINELKAEGLFRLGVEFVLGQYFTRTHLAIS